MAEPGFTDLVTLSSTAGGLFNETMSERTLTLLAMLASGTYPDGTPIPPPGTGTFVPRLVGDTLTVAPLPYVNIEDYTGTDYAAWNKAYTALGGDTGAGGIILLPPRSTGYQLDNGTVGCVNNNPKIGMLGLGSTFTAITPSAAFTGIEYQAVNPNFDPTGTVAPSSSAPHGGFTIDGTTAGNGAIGFQLADHVRDTWNDVTVQNFSGTGSEGVRVTSLVANGTANSGWVERWNANAFTLANNTTNIHYFGADLTTGTSFNYCHPDYRLTLYAGQTGVKYDNKFIIFEQEMKLRYNCHIGTGGSPTIISLGADGIFGTLTGLHWTVGGENAGSSNYPVNLNVGSNCTLQAFGSANFTGTSNTCTFTSGSAVSLAGYLNCAGAYSNTANVDFVTYSNTATSQILVQGVANVSQLKVTTNSTGAGTALLGTNCPAVTVSAPYTWFKCISSDGSTVYLPAWK
jgi:hypothetical protein